jgi:hypothetical protein
MKTNLVLLLNGKEIENAREKGFEEPEERNEWGTLWVDLQKSYAAFATVTMIDGRRTPVLKICMDEDDSFLVEDSPEVRKALDLRFNRVHGLS